MVTLENARATILQRFGGARRDLIGLPILEGFREMLEFYEIDRLQGASPDGDDDMLLFQWGTHDWYDGDGEHYSVDLTRQLIVGPGEDEDIHQLALTYRFTSGAASRALGNGNRWCKSPVAINEFRQYVLASPAVLAVIAETPLRVQLSFGTV